MSVRSAEPVAIADFTPNAWTPRLSPTNSMANLAQTPPSPRRGRISTSMSRRSSLMHEIQPPARRLSAHQVLLLTPFGGTIPLDTPAMGRERSSLPRSSLRPSAMVREPSQGPPSPRSTYTAPRTRHSLATLAAPSPLSQPLATIASDSSGPSSAAASREPSSDEPDMLVAVPMTRSNSLPVLTLRELEAMKDKDAELGIARGGEWAWVGREDDETPVEDELETPGLSDASTLSSTPPAFPFHDPFVQQGTYRRTEETARFGSYQPVATADGYQYSPSQRDRRVSDIPSTSPKDPHSTPRPGPSSGLESPRGTRMPAHQRPRITRYKTSPALSQGLGLSVVVRPEQTSGVRIDVEAGGSLGRKGRINLSTVERREQRHAQMRERGEFGAWTPVEIVDGLEHRSSISSISSRGSYTFARNSMSSSTSSRRNLLLVESARTMSLSESGRSRVDSLDSPKSIYPRRGSLQPVVGVWRQADERRGSGELAVGVWKKADERSASGEPKAKGEWYERRGSWAEGWKKEDSIP